jgi:hypothetical protein
LRRVMKLTDQVFCPIYARQHSTVNSGNREVVLPADVSWPSSLSYPSGARLAMFAVNGSTALGGQT